MKSDDEKKGEFPKNTRKKVRPPTSRDVAKLANVSRATVSYVLNDVPDSRISEETKERVLIAAKEIGYVPHKMASTLRTGQSNLVFLPFFDWPYNQNSIEFLQDLARRLRDMGYTVMLQFFDAAENESAAKKMASFHPIGVVALAEGLSVEDIDILIKNGVKAILPYSNTPSSSTSTLLESQVLVDFNPVGEKAADYLISKGHKHIAAVVPKDHRILELGEQRYSGVLRRCKQDNIKVDRVEMDYDQGQVVELIKSWQGGDHPTAVFTYNDEYGYIFLRVLQDAGYSIPGDIALIGCDNLPFSELTDPRLTSIEIGNSQIVDRIISVFDDLINDRAADVPHFAMAEPTVVERDSC